MSLALLAATVALSVTSPSPDAKALGDAVRPPVPALRLSRQTSLAEAQSLKSAGLAKTAVERRADDAALALGFLCGREPGAGRTGAAATHGYDPAGRFLGARLSFAFR